jgi:hypothetical protein
VAPKIGHKFNFSAEFLRRRGARIRAAKTGKQGTPEERFWRKVNKCDESTDGCHVWIGASDDHGYGMFRPYGRGKSSVRASGFSLELKLGRPLKDGFKALHTYDNPPCVRWEHLYEGTSLDNATDRGDSGRTAIGENNGRTILDIPTVIEIRRRHALGESAAELARWARCSTGAVYSIVKRDNWKWLP